MQWRAGATIQFEFDADDFESTSPLLIPAANQNNPKIVRLKGFGTATRAAGTLIHPAPTFPDQGFLIQTTGAGPATDLQPVLHVDGMNFYNLHFKDKAATAGKINVGGIQFECDDVGRRTCVVENSWFQYMWRGLELRGSVWWGYFRNLLFHDANTNFVGENDIRLTDGGHTNATNPSVKECRFTHIEVKHDGRMNNSFVMRSGGYNKIDGYHVSGEEYLTAVWNLTKLDTLMIHNNRFRNMDMIDVDTVPSPDVRGAALLLFGSTGVFDNQFDDLYLTPWPYMVKFDGVGVANNSVQLNGQHSTLPTSINDTSTCGPNNVINVRGGNITTAANLPVTTVNGLVRIIDDRAGAERSGATSVADGGTITHGLMTTPLWIIVIGSVASQVVAVTAKTATTFTVSIKTLAGAAGTTQTVYWRAGVYA